MYSHFFRLFLGSIKDRDVNFDTIFHNFFQQLFLSQLSTEREISNYDGFIGKIVFQSDEK